MLRKSLFRKSLPKSPLFMALLLAYAQVSNTQNSTQTYASGGQTWNIEAVMPDHPAPPETYLCMGVNLPDTDSLKLTGIEPLSQEALVHHMLLFGCSTATTEEGVWSCQGHGVCPSGGNQQILYGWAKGAPAMHLPRWVGYKVGRGTKIDNLVLQIHYAVERPKGNISGVKLSLTNGHIPFSAGMMMYASSFQIPPKQEKHLIPNKCCYSGFEPTHGFAFRVHTHMLGRSVYLDDISSNEQRRRVVEHSPQLPQGFTSVSETVFWPGQRLEATCEYNSMERDQTTWAGATHHHEMCNLYMITWSELPVFMNCFDSFTSVDYHGAGGVPEKAELVREDAKVWRPAQASRSSNQPQGQQLEMGQIAGIAKGLNGSVWVFCRGDRVWDGSSFTGSRNEQVTYTEPIKQKTVFQLDQDTGEILASWGEELFYMPHMITLDQAGHIWLTDVGLHQVFKFDAQGKLLLTLGKRLEPGSGSGSGELFCKPTQVAVSVKGAVYVSDGYCNSRVAQFTPEGEFQGDFALPDGAMNVPHSVLLHECSDTLIVADRESSKVHQFELASREYKATWDLQEEGLVFGLAFGPYGTVFALCWDRDHKHGGKSQLLLLHGDPSNGVDQKWELEGVEAPHDLSIIAAPIRLSGSDRPLAVLVGETRQSGSRLHKYILLPNGDLNVSVSGDAVLPSASEQWQAVLEGAAISQQEIPPEIVAAKTADVRHSQALTDDAATAEAHHHRSDWSTVQDRGRNAGLIHESGSKDWQSQNQWSFWRQGMLIVIPLLGCVAAIVVAYRRVFSQ